MTLKIVIAALLFLPTVSMADVWSVRPGEGTEVRFTSKAAMESFDGTTGEVEGRIVADPSRLVGDVDVEIVVDLASLDTGIGLRNRHMRDNHLHTEEYPVARFRAGRVVEADRGGVNPGGAATIVLEGTFELHGVVRPMTAEATLDLRSDGALVVSSSFVVKLSDHGVPRPKFLVMKLADEQKVRVELVALPASSDQPR